MTDLLNFFRTMAREKLDHERFLHTLGVENLATELAERYQTDRNSASLAALAHDIAKAFPLEVQLEKAKAWKLIYYKEDIENPQVIHGRIAAWILENEYAINNRDILNAVANHTLGRPGMSPLEMLIYSADLTEPRRNFAGVDKLREKLYYDLKEGTIACVAHTLNYLKENNRVIHPLTVLTYEDLKQTEIIKGGPKFDNK